MKMLQSLLKCSLSYLLLIQAKHVRRPDGICPRLLRKGAAELA